MYHKTHLLLDVYVVVVVFFLLKFSLNCCGGASEYVPDLFRNRGGRIDGYGAHCICREDGE